ncbi:unnamed protein product [Caenorhabditis sp. 36 PRJEB53466]|nr:unnamed protein product [Caenorhabditis sp. 36 PRJEB53466]
MFVLFAIVAVAAAQSISFNGASRLPCQLTCSTSATFTTNIDGSSTTARCTDTSSDPTTRCPGCCASVALAAGLTADRAAGFPSNNGRSCVCCIRGC